MRRFPLNFSGPDAPGRILRAGEGRPPKLACGL